MDGLKAVKNILGIKEASSDMPRVYECHLRYNDRLLRSLDRGSYTQKVKYGCELSSVPVGNTRRPLLPLEEKENWPLKKSLQRCHW